MSLEQLEQKNNLSGLEQEKAMELSKTIESIYDFVNNANDSNVAEETREEIVGFVNGLKKQGIDPMDFYLWNLFIVHGDSDTSFEWKKFDTEDGDIEKFIGRLEKLKIENKHN
jgi:hypothetical protein